MPRFVYADNAATTRLSDRALQAMLPYFQEHYGNPSSLYRHAQQAKEALEEARKTVARCLNASPEEIFFTSGGTESDNWAILKGVEGQVKKGKHIITSAIEHHAVHHTLRALEQQGYEVTYLPVDERGQISPAELERAIRPDTALITVMAANNEVGTILPAAEIGAVARRRGVLFHTDAVQAAGHIPVDVEKWKVDLLSLSAHKFHGPKGVGVLYRRKGVFLPPLIHGGGQERGLRSGTENVAGAVGLAAALQDAVEHLKENGARLTALRDRLIAGVLNIPRSRLTGDPVNRLPGTASFVFECVEGESILLRLDGEGVCASTGSACSSASLEPSHVLLAMGIPHEIAHGSLRLTLCEGHTEEDVDYLIEKVTEVVGGLRAMSPIWNE